LGSGDAPYRSNRGSLAHQQLMPIATDCRKGYLRCDVTKSDITPFESFASTALNWCGECPVLTLECRVKPSPFPCFPLINRTVGVSDASD
jgi:hypothetical protein